MAGARRGAGGSGRTWGACVAAAALLALPLAAAHGFHDDDYHELVLFAWDTAELDILIVPPASPHAPWRVAAVEQSIDAWQQGIAAFGPAWMQGIALHRATLGFDVPSPAALADPEILVVSTEPGVLGIGLPRNFLLCAILSDLLDGAHRHEGSPWVVLPACPFAPDVCFVVNTSWDTYQNFLYDLNAHEVGHCLGIGHVGDALDYHATTVPQGDVMSYQHDPAQVKCVSNLNILAMEAVFAGVLGAAPPPLEPAPGISFAQAVRMAPPAYGQLACANPPPSPLPDPDWFPDEELLDTETVMPREPMGAP